MVFERNCLNQFETNLVYAQLQEPFVLHLIMTIK